MDKLIIGFLTFVLISFDCSAISTKQFISIRGSRDNPSVRYDYIGNYEFEEDSLLRVNTPYGFFDGKQFNSYLIDYQGNIRNVVRPVGRSDFELVQQNFYYPYGLPVACSYSPDANSYKYGAKEFDTRQGLNLADFEARFNDLQLGRFTTVDNYADKYTWLSPYLYCAANPIKYVDEDGNSLTVVAAFLVKVVVSAAIDATAQVYANVASGKSVKDAIRNIDITSVLTSAFIGGFTCPGMSNASKIAVNTAIVIDAAVDYNVADGIKYPLGKGNNHKKMTDVIIDGLLSKVPVEPTKSIKNDFKVVFDELTPEVKEDVTIIVEQNDAIINDMLKDIFKKKYENNPINNLIGNGNSQDETKSK